MRVVTRIQFQDVDIPIMIDKDIYYLPCSEVLLGALKYKQIGDSHFHRKYKGDIDYCGFSDNKWYFTQFGFTKMCEQSNKQGAKELLLTVTTKIEHLCNKQFVKEQTNVYDQIIQCISNTEQLAEQILDLKNTLSVQQMLFQNQQFKIYGTAEEPLFLVNDIVCGLLEMSKIHNNQFFTDNRNNIQYVNLLEFPASSIDLQERFKKSNINHIYFFTEKGLYKCLMGSNKPIAQQFQDEVCDVLKKIRMINTNLVINNVQTIKTDLQQYKTQLTDLSANHSDICVDMLANKNKINKATKHIQLYELKTADGLVYRGQTKDFNKRVKQHRSNSCNPIIREAYSNGQIVSESVVREVDVLTDDDIKFEESKFIREVQPAVQANKTTPKPDLLRITTNDMDITSEQDLDDLSTVIEQSVANEYKKTPHPLIQKNNDLLMTKYNQVLAYVNTYNKLPSKHNSDKQIQSLGYWIADMKKDESKLSRDKYDLLTQIPGWKWAKRIQVEEFLPFNDMFDLLQTHLQKNKEYPTAIHSNANNKRLYLWTMRIRSQYIKKQLSDEQIHQFEQLENWSWVTKDQWYKSYQQMLTDKDIMKRWIREQRDFYAKGLLNEERIAILESIEGWTWNIDEKWQQMYEQVRDYIKEHGVVPTKGQLGKFSGHQREYYQNKTLQEDRFNKLEQLRPIWYWNVQQKAQQ